MINSKKNFDTTDPSDVSKSLTLFIKEQSRNLGFSAVGIARAEKLSREEEELSLWLKNGFQASMHWMEKEPDRRCDPSMVLPGARSVVCVAMNYFTSAPHSDNPDTGKISRYAWGDDYHLLLTERLDALLGAIQKERSDLPGKVYVDTGPVMEKVWAVKAGIGWMGKHTNILSTAGGSWMFLGAILLDVELEYDVPVSERCGTCTACLDACPTHALVAPYVLDARACLSYLTIEHRGAFPSELIPKLQRWVYGCDICQDVCPWNRVALETSESAFHPRKENIAPPLSELQSLTQEEFTVRFKRSPVKRAKLEGIRRNASAALQGRQNTE